MEVREMAVRKRGLLRMVSWSWKLPSSWNQKLLPPWRLFSDTFKHFCSKCLLKIDVMVWYFNWQYSTCNWFHHSHRVSLFLMYYVFKSKAPWVILSEECRVSLHQLNKHLIHFEIVFWMEQKIKNVGFYFFFKSNLVKRPESWPYMAVTSKDWPGIY